MDEFSLTVVGYCPAVQRPDHGAESVACSHAEVTVGVAMASHRKAPDQEDRRSKGDWIDSYAPVSSLQGKLVSTETARWQ